MEILINAEGILGDERTVIEQLQFGGVDLPCVSVAFIGICAGIECPSASLSVYRCGAYVEGAGRGNRGQLFRFL